MKLNRFEIKLLAACVMYALCVGYVFADEWRGKDKQLHLVGGAQSCTDLPDGNTPTGGP